VIHATQVIKLDPSSHGGCEGKHAVLHGMGHHSEAFEAFRMMLSRLEQSLVSCSVNLADNREF
jgi:hypothetical protein